MGAEGSCTWLRSLQEEGLQPVEGEVVGGLGGRHGEVEAAEDGTGGVQAAEDDTGGVLAGSYRELHAKGYIHVHSESLDVAKS